MVLSCRSRSLRGDCIRGLGMGIQLRRGHLTWLVCRVALKALLCLRLLRLMVLAHVGLTATCQHHCPQALGWFLCLNLFHCRCLLVRRVLPGWGNFEAGWRANLAVEVLGGRPRLPIVPPLRLLS